MDKNQAVFGWIKTYPGIGRLYFNFGVAQDGNQSFVPNPTERIVKRDVLGNETKHYDFAVTAYRSISTEAGTDENILDYCGVSEFIAWVNEQNKSKNYPDFGDGCYIENIECLQNIPAQSGVDGELAKYMIQCRITYEETEN